MNSNYFFYFRTHISYLMRLNNYRMGLYEPCTGWCPHNNAGRIDIWELNPKSPGQNCVPSRAKTQPPEAYGQILLGRRSGVRYLPVFRKRAVMFFLVFSRAREIVISTYFQENEPGLPKGQVVISQIVSDFDIVCRSLTDLIKSLQLMSVFDRIYKKLSSPIRLLRLILIFDKVYENLNDFINFLQSYSKLGDSQTRCLGRDPGRSGGISIGYLGLVP